MAKSFTFNLYKRYAALLPESYEKMDITVMADRFIEAKKNNDEYNKNIYIAGLMLRFWFAIKNYEEKSPGLGLTTDDYAAWLYEAIEYACDYEAWHHGKAKNAQQAINKAIETIRLQHYALENMDKRKANYGTVSLDAPVSDDSDVVIGDRFEDDASKEEFENFQAKEMVQNTVQTLLDDNKMVEAIILDTIAYQDVYKDTKTVVQGEDEEGNPCKYTRHSYSFWPFKCVQFLSNLPEDFAQYFYDKYEVSAPALVTVLDKIKKANNQKLYKYLDLSLKAAKNYVKV